MAYVYDTVTESGGCSSDPGDTDLRHGCEWWCGKRGTWDTNCPKCDCAACGPCMARAASAPPTSQHKGCARASWMGGVYPDWAHDYKQKAASNKGTHFGGMLRVPEWEYGLTIILSFGLCQVAHCGIKAVAGAPIAEVTDHGGAECKVELLARPPDPSLEMLVVTYCESGSSVRPFIECPDDGFTTALATDPSPPPPLGGGPSSGAERFAALAGAAVGASRPAASETGEDIGSRLGCYAQRYDDLFQIYCGGVLTACEWRAAAHTAAAAHSCRHTQPTPHFPI